MTAKELFQAGRLDEAIERLNVELRSDPTDVQRRTFLFELLCFAGNWDRAERQLDVLSSGSHQAMLGTLLYRSAIHAERTRAAMFEAERFPEGTTVPRPASGVANGKPFATLVDGDPRIGARLEVFAAGQYTWLPLEGIASISIAPPRQLRDLLWARALVRTAPAMRDLELGEVLLPVLTPLAWKHPDPAVRLGRVTEWEALDDEREAPVGQKMLLVDDDELPLLELRELQITPASQPVA